MRYLWEYEYAKFNPDMPEIRARIGQRETEEEVSRQFRTFLNSYGNMGWEVIDIQFDSGWVTFKRKHELS